MDPLASFAPATRSWFERAFDAPTSAQALGWPAIASGAHVLIQAPTGSGKTLAAFLSAIDRLTAKPGEGLRLLYVSPQRTFDAPTPAQALGWPAIATGEHVLIQAPTGSGKTLAAFLYAIDRLTATPGEGLRLLYVSPLKALNYDIERNLRGPLAGLESTLRVGVRTGDTPAEGAARARQAARPTS